jgi:hypothetical protein
MSKTSNLKMKLTMSNILLNHKLTILENILLRPCLEMTRAVAKNFMVNPVAKSLTWMQLLNFGNIVRKYLKMNLI